MVMIVPMISYVLTKLALAIILIASTSVLGCGVLPQGTVSSISFNASGFTLPAQMAYSENPAVQTAITSISRSRDAAIRVVRNLVMNAVNDVLQEQGRSAFLPDAVISLILQQLNLTIEYTPLNCPTATDKPDNAGDLAMKDGCIIINGLVVGLCTMNGGAAMCNLMAMIANVMPTPTQHRTIRGILITSNVVMATWSKQMWQSVLTRVYQRIASGEFGKYFSTAVVTLNN